MKTYLPFLMLLIVTVASSQNQNLEGQFTGKNLDKSFINVINLNQSKATISKTNGKFEIPAKVGDSILISSIQYVEVKFLVKPEFFEQQIEIPLKLKVNDLEQVNLYSLGLTGNLETDVKHIKTDEPLIMDIRSFDISNAYDEKVTIQSDFTYRNVALEYNQIPSSINIKAIPKLLSKLFNGKEKNNKPTIYQSNKLRDLDFLINYLEIDSDNVGQFIEYAKLNGLKKEMLKKENELDLIEFLIELSKTFKAEYEK